MPKTDFTPPFLFQLNESTEEIRLQSHKTSNVKSQITSNNGAAQSAQKPRGGYYTPKPVAEFLANWAVKDQNAICLEPSAGDGEFVVAAASRLSGRGHILAVELHHDEAAKVVARGGAGTTVVEGDFFSWFQDCRPIGSFDVVLGNPPFIRYHDFPEEHRQPAFALMREEGLKPSRLTNAWLPFVVTATRALRSGGRLALVLPAELLQVMYAAELREYLASKYSRLIIVTFRRLIFSGIQEEIVLLLGVRGDGPAAEISFLELDGVEDLQLSHSKVAAPVRVDLNHAREKWTQYYLSPGELGLIREVERSDVFGRLCDFAEVDVGIVTGRNEFFVLTRDEAERYEVLSWCLPLVGRSAQIPGIVLRLPEWQQLATDGGKCFLVQLGNVERSELPKGALSYIERGEELGFHKGYKCAVRLPRWWNIPSAWEPDAFLLRQIHDGPRIIQNHAGVTCTDTIHRVRTLKGVDSSWLAAASLNSMTFAFAEIKGRSYGGGVLELEPTEAEGLPFPKPQAGVQPLSIEELDNLIRRKGVETALIETDRLVLKVAGVSDSEVTTLRGIWQKLSVRRRDRKRR